MFAHVWHLYAMSAKKKFFKHFFLPSWICNATKWDDSHIFTSKCHFILWIATVDRWNIRLMIRNYLYTHHMQNNSPWLRISLLFFAKQFFLIKYINWELYAVDKLRFSQRWQYSWSKRPTFFFDCILNIHSYVMFSSSNLGNQVHRKLSAKLQTYTNLTKIFKCKESQWTYFIETHPEIANSIFSWKLLQRKIK